jgi:Uma2 family endonuclease
MTIRTTLPPLPIQEQPWPAQGEWTYEDYLRLPDDGRRYEIIRGVLYVIGPPTVGHQLTIGAISLALHPYVRSSRLGVLLFGPFEIHLPGIAYPVQPDIFVIPAWHRPKPDDHFFEGAPPLIVEVSDLETLRRDRSTKLDAYEQAGVREYWLANPRIRSIMIYTLPAEGQEYILLGEFSAGETLHSAVLPGLELAVETLFTS